MLGYGEEEKERKLHKLRNRKTKEKYNETKDDGKVEQKYEHHKIRFIFFLPIFISLNVFEKKKIIPNCLSVSFFRQNKHGNKEEKIGKF